MTSGWTLERFFEEFGWLDVKDGCKLSDDIKPNGRDGPFDTADIRPINIGIVGQLLLGDFPQLP